MRTLLVSVALVLIAIAGIVVWALSPASPPPSCTLTDGTVTLVSQGYDCPSLEGWFPGDWTQGASPSGPVSCTLQKDWTITVTVYGDGRSLCLNATQDGWAQ